MYPSVNSECSIPFYPVSPVSIVSIVSIRPHVVLICNELSTVEKCSFCILADMSSARSMSTEQPLSCSLRSLESEIQHLILCDEYTVHKPRVSTSSRNDARIRLLRQVVFLSTLAKYTYRTPGTVQAEVSMPPFAVPLVRVQALL